MASRTVLDGLQLLGLNALEAEVYVHLLRTGPATGYQVARAIGRPTANVYKAVEALARRGAALIEDGRARLCRAVPAKDFLGRARKQFADLAQTVESDLADLAPPPDDERVYRLESIEQVWSTVDTMVAEARQVVVADAFPRALAHVRPALERAIKRGVRVYLEAYEPTTLRGAEVALVPMGRDSVETWKAQQLNLVVDGRQHLLALLDSAAERVLQAVASRSLYMSCLQHAGRLCEHTLIRAIAAARDGRRDDALAIMESHPFFASSRVPGHVELVRRYAARRRS